MGRLKIAFEWEWERAKEIFPLWRDGLRACMEIIEKKHDVDWLLFETPKKKYDWILTWCDSNSNFSRNKSTYKAKRGIFLTTHPTNYENLKGFDVIFCESSVIYNEVRRQGLRAVKAFGTDDEFYKGNRMTKDIDYFYPATFSPWKRQSDIAHLGKSLLCVGTIQPDGMKEYEACKINGVQLKVGYFPPSHILDYYRRSKSVMIPAIHGSERTVLESMSCGILPWVTSKNERACSYINEYADFKGTLRQFINRRYSAKRYARIVCKALAS